MFTLFRYSFYLALIEIISHKASLKDEKRGTGVKNKFMIGRDKLQPLSAQTKRRLSKTLSQLTKSRKSTCQSNSDDSK